MQCVPGGGGYGCGNYFEEYDCGDTAACDSDSVCQGYTEGCGRGSRCVPACWGDDGCASTETCDPDAHLCITRPCTDPAVTCEQFTHCDDGTGTCAPDECIGNVQCHGGYCVNGTCAGEPGTCSMARQ